MKKLIIASMVVVFIHINAAAEIKNGYVTSSINDTRIVLNNFKKALTESRSRNNKSGEKLTHNQKRKLKSKIDSLEYFIRYYELSEKLLVQFRAIAPELYNEIDSIKDKNGISTDVYIKFVSTELLSLGQNALTIMSQKGHSKGSCFSEYGKHTVSVIVAAGVKALWLLAHEFGHIMYQVPHLAEYNEYYKRSYVKKSFKSNFIGHNDKDMSGEIAINFGRRYLQEYKKYRKSIKDGYKAPIALAK